jgi:hypothetical protein
MESSKMTTQEERETRIQDWIAAIVRDGGIERYDDLHVDQIDTRWASREYWLQAGLEAFGIAVRLRNSQMLDLGVVLAFSLKSSENREGVDFSTSQALEAQLDWSPPSLYLFRRGREPWTQVGAEAVQLDARSLFGRSPLDAKECYYLEFKQPESPEYFRTVFLAG